MPILNVSDTRVAAPWFGANKWEAIIQPVYGGGIPPQHAELTLIMEFKEGGAFDFASMFDRLKERLRQAVDVAGMSGAGALAGVNLSSVHLEDLPAYEDTSRHARVPEEMPSSPLGQTRRDVGAGSEDSTAEGGSPGEGSRVENLTNPPTGPPPGYEEVQQNSVAEEMERRLRSAGER